MRVSCLSQFAGRFARLLALSLSLAAIVRAEAVAQPAGDSETIRRDLSGEGAGASRALDIASLRSFYAARDYAPAWEGSAEATGNARILEDRLAHADEDGLDPAQYRINESSTQRPPTDSDEIAQADMAMSDAALRYARDLSIGQAELRELDTDVELPGKTFSPALLADALRNGQLADYLSALAPSQPDYARLKVALARYRSLAASGGWPQLPSARPSAFQPGGADNALLQQRLAYEDNSADMSDVTAALERFQQRHGLGADGRVGSRTLAALNVTASQRVMQIIANMERWRWMPHAFEANYVEINVPAAQLEVVDNGKIVLSSRVIVGRPQAPTPILRAVATSVTINPPWNVPSLIARKEILPKLKRNRGYLEAQDMILLDGPAGDPHGKFIAWRSYPKGVFPFRVRQLPGEKNALGRVKLELPNRFDVYLHDTPGKRAFALDERFLSHGCVRVAEILGLASYALTHDTTSAVMQLETGIATDETFHLPVLSPLPIYFAYWTAFVDDDGTVEFRPDIYGRDDRLIAALMSHVAREQVTERDVGCHPA